MSIIERNQKTIVYIEDEPNNRMLVRRVMEQMGFKVVEAPDAMQGMSTVEDVKPDLILMDINMPGMNGYELTTKIKSNEDLSKIPIVAVTVAAGKGEKEMAIMAGCDGFIAKPINVDMFPSQVEAYLQGEKEEVAPEKKSHYLKEYSQRLVNRLDEKISELSLADKEWEDTFNAISDMVAILDKDHHIIKANKAFSERVSLSQDKVSGTKCYVTLCDRTDACERCPYEETLRDNKPANLEMHNLHLGGIFLVNTYPIFATNGNLARIILVAIDITAKTEMEEQIYQMEKLSEIGELISGVAHELNNPLTGIIGVSQLLLAYEEVPDKVKKDIESIFSEAERAGKIVRELLNFSRKYKPEKRELNINDVVRGVLALTGYQMKSDNIDSKVNLEESLPKIYGDFHQLQQVLINIINNARFALTQESDGGTLEIRSTRRDGEVLLAISDDGPGIKKENLQKLFEPFFTTKEHGKGTGLGLSICRKIITNHNGAIEVETEVGRGTTFLIKLPVPN